MKNLKLRTVLCLGFLFALSTAFAQTSGYMGKRLLLQAGMHVSPAFLNASPKDFIGEVGLNITKAYQLEYVLNRKISLGLSYNTAKTRTVFEESLETYVFEDLYSDEYSTNYNYIDVDGTIDATAFGISLNYYTRNVAPLGSYVKTEFQYIPYTFTRNYAEAGSEELDYIFIDPDGYHTYALKLEFGRQNIYFNRVVTNIGFSMGYVFDSFLKLYLQEPNQYSTVYYHSNTRLLMMTVFNVKLGIGLLAF